MHLDGGCWPVLARPVFEQDGLDARRRLRDLRSRGSIFALRCLSRPALHVIPLDPFRPPHWGNPVSICTIDLPCNCFGRCNPDLHDTSCELVVMASVSHVPT